MAPRREATWTGVSWSSDIRAIPAPQATAYWRPDASSARRRGCAPVGMDDADTAFGGQGRGATMGADAVRARPRRRPEIWAMHTFSRAPRGRSTKGAPSDWLRSTATERGSQPA